MLWTLDHLLLVTLVAIFAAVLLVVCIFLGLHRHYPHEATRTGIGTAGVSIVVAVLFTVVLNNLYALRRDRDSRLRNLRDQHYTQLKPVLRTESSNLAHVSEEMARLAHLTQIGQWDNTNENPPGLLWPDVLSRDLRNHFPEYDQSKRALISQIQAQDQEYGETRDFAQRQIDSVKLDPYWKVIDSQAFVLKCLGRGHGVQLRVEPGNFYFETGFSSAGGSGQPSPDQVAAASAFGLMKMDADLSKHCESLKARADSIQNTSKELARQAELLGESTILPGDCGFITSDNLLY